MSSHRRFSGRLPARAAARLALLLPLSLTVSLAGARAAGAAQPPPDLGVPAPPVVSAPPLTLTLPECLDTAHQRHPKIAAQRASLAAAEDGRRALDALRVPALIVPDLPVRRRQAALGVTAAAAALEQAEREVAYGVIRTYFTVLYARAQEQVARNVVERLIGARDAAKTALEEGRKGVTDADVRRTEIFVHLAKTKRIQAAEGVKRALAALREAVGLGPDACLDVPPTALPVPSARPCKGDVIAAALARRAELVQAGVLADVTCLEVEAQGTSSHKKMETFAIGSDLHSHPVPQTVYSPQYRPGAIAPEMPALLGGSRGERVRHARDLHARAQAVVEGTRNLIALEAEDAYLRWEEASQQAAEARKAADMGDELARDLNKDFRAKGGARADEMVNAAVIASQARAQYNEFLFQQIVALADLERVTAGGFCARLVEEVAPRVLAPAVEGGSR
jgi:outer membrane protein TolC